MQIDRKPARWIILLLIVAALAWTEASLHGGNSYYFELYRSCKLLHGATAPFCTTWRDISFLRIVAIIAVGGALWIYNERRQPR